MEGVLPVPDYPCDLEWRWPWAKFELPAEALFTTLHQRFNTRRCPIQEPYAFHKDVCESAEYSATLEEFYAQLSARRNQRVHELDEAWRNIASILAWSTDWHCPGCGKQSTSDISENDDAASRWSSFCDLSLTMSFDSLVRFFDGWCRDRRRLEAERHEELKRDVQAILQERRRIETPASPSTACAINTGPETAAETATTTDGGSTVRTSDAFQPASPESLETDSNDDSGLRKEGNVVGSQKDRSPIPCDERDPKTSRTTAAVNGCPSAPRKPKRPRDAAREEPGEDDSTNAQKRRRASRERLDACATRSPDVEKHDDTMKIRPRPPATTSASDLMADRVGRADEAEESHHRHGSTKKEPPG